MGHLSPEKRALFSLLKKVGGHMPPPVPRPLIFDPGKKVNSREELIKIIDVVKDGKYSLAKFAYFVYDCITCGNCYHF
jgi:hypothetical protein